jgi:hypothetical protein
VTGISPRHLDDLLEGLAQKNVELWIQGERLAYEELGDPLTQAEAEFLERHNEELVGAFTRPGRVLRSFPLSRGQQGLLYLHDLMPQSSSYHMAFPIRIHSPVDPGALQRALQIIVNRHACLRTIFERRVTGEPIQHVLAYSDVALEVVDCSDLGDTELDRAVVSRYGEPFDLYEEPPVRAHLFTRSTDDHVFLLNIHHIVTDGLSLWTMLTDLRNSYRAEISDEPVSLSPLGSPYAEFVEWERELLQRPEMEEDLAFWRSYLEGAPAFLDIPSDRKRPSLPSGRGELTMFKLDPDVLERVEHFTKQHGIKLRTILLAAYQLVLHRYSGQDELLIGFETAGRPALRFARTCGYFVNPVVFRSSFAGDISCLQFLRDHEDGLTSTLEHQNMPFAFLVEQLSFSRDPRYLPLVQVEFNYIRLPRGPGYEDLMIYVDDAPRSDFGGLQASSYGLTQQAGQYDLSLTVSRVRDEHWGGIKANTDLFDSDDVIRMIEVYQTLLNNIVRDPDLPIGRLALVTEMDADPIRKAGQLAEDDDEWLPAHVLFESRAAQTPEAAAVVAGGVSVTYRDLNHRADLLAAELVEFGVREDVVVGVSVERSVNMVVAVLGVLKAGGSYAPLDASLPRSRLDFMIQDAGIEVILTQTRLRDSFQGSSATLIDLDDPARACTHRGRPGTRRVSRSRRGQWPTSCSQHRSGPVSSRVTCFLP